MDPSDVIQFIVLAFLLCLSAFFSSAETALTMVNKIRIKVLADEGDKSAKVVMNILDNQSKMLSAILVGNNIVNLSASSISTTLATKHLGGIGAGIATGVITFLILIFGEISPKTYATIAADKLSLKYGRIIYVLMYLFTPIILIVNLFSMAFLRLLRVDPNARSTMTETELRSIVDVSHEDGVIETEEKEMIYNVFDLGDSQAKDIMVPRIDMVFVNVDSSYDELLAIFREHMYTRLPVYEDTTDNVIGTVNIKDILLLNPQEDFHIRNILRDPYFTYAYKNTSELMIEMRKNSIGLTIVLDEYGATAGLITMEDLLEEIVGEIRDEYDQDEVDSISQISEFEYALEGSAKLDDLNEQLHTNLYSEDYDSIGGFIIEALDRLPKADETLTTDNGIVLTVASCTKNRIDKVHLKLPEDFYQAEAKELER